MNISMEVMIIPNILNERLLCSNRGHDLNSRGERCDNL